MTGELAHATACRNSPNDLIAPGMRQIRAARRVGQVTRAIRVDDALVAR
jgi:hypothetical protein